MEEIKKGKPFRNITKFDQLGIVIVLVALVVVIGISNSNFFSQENIINVLRSTSYIFIIGIAMTFVLITGGLDLSVGSVMAVGGILAALAATNGIPLIPSMLIGFAFGAAVGIVNGLLVVKLNIPSLIVTLGMMYVCDGLSLIITQGTPVYPLPDDFKQMGQGSVGIIPNVVVVAAVLAVIGAFVLKKTQYGRSVYAVGGNRETARLSGIDTNKVQISVYVLSGIAAALTGILMAGRLNSAQPSAGNNYELKVIAAAVIGGTSMFGGSGNILGTLIGALLMTVIENGMLLMKLSAYWQSLIVGVIMVFAVGLDQYRRKRLGLSS
ncbi:ABC transporter permease [Christensenella tenuis]|uniref:ABC transporter permease n=1 Tax=Christensenella tenuis TaxID=2763033 RepID=A0ABR7EIA0_9FIRM|nr:ABC transporter permease [Christensenella tenuis]MBC5649101.1 ABC transporter permease [Christensenella tenuis]